MWEQLNASLRKLLRILPVIIILAGIALRIAVYLQNRCLIIDEANIARNLVERDFQGLALPLNYQQYAPPIFLWILKLCTSLLGYSEYALKLYPLICGCLSLVLLYKVLRVYTGFSSIWYALLMVAAGFIYLRYTTEVKQYISDVVIILSLILLSLKLDIHKLSPVRFFLVWFVLGSLSIWWSMPAVFMLAAVGVYYLYIVLIGKTYNKLPLLAATGIVWAAQFVFYYFAILKPQIHSDHLQNWHSQFFLTAFPNSTDDIVRNWNVFSNVLGNAAGHWALSVIFHMVTIVVATVYLLRKHPAKAILIILPVILTLAAAAMHQFSLVPRVVLFMMVLLIVLVAKGLELLLLVPYVPVRIALVVVAIICLVNFSRFDMFANRFDNEELSQSLDFLQQQRISGRQLYVHELANPAYIYYTQIHPDKEGRKELLGANILTWQTNYEALAKTMNGRFAIVHSWIEFPDKYNQEQAEISKYHQLDTSFNNANTHVLIYGRTQ